jgi:hypothetical protein
VQRQNVTLALPVAMVKRLRVLAAQRGTSISRLLTDQLHDLLEQHSGHARARRRSLRALEQGWNLGTSGEAAWTRESVHER